MKPERVIDLQKCPFSSYIEDTEASFLSLVAARAEAEEAEARAQAQPETALPYNLPPKRAPKLRLEPPPNPVPSPSPSPAPSPAEDAPTGMGRLRVCNGEAEADFPLLKAATTIGRGTAPEVDVPIDWNDGVSRQHAVVLRRQGRFWVVDRGSTNGSWLNGKRLAPYAEMPFNPGDRLRIGARTEIVFFRSESDLSADPQETVKAA